MEPGPVEGLAVELRRLNIHVFTGIVFRGDFKCLFHNDLILRATASLGRRVHNCVYIKIRN